MTEPSFGTTVWTSQTVSPSMVAVHGSTLRCCRPGCGRRSLPFFAVDHLDDPVGLDAAVLDRDVVADHVADLDLRGGLRRGHDDVAGHDARLHAAGEHGRGAVAEHVRADRDQQEDGQAEQQQQVGEPAEHPARQRAARRPTGSTDGAGRAAAAAAATRGETGRSGRRPGDAGTAVVLLMVCLLAGVGGGRSVIDVKVR